MQSAGYSLKDLIEFCFLTKLVFVSLFVLAIVIALIIFDIISLIEYSSYDIEYLCASSALWYYVLVCCICTVFQILVVWYDRIGIQSAIVPTVLLIWGTIEYLKVSCIRDVAGTSIYTMGLMNLAISYLGVGICVICIFFSIAMGKMENVLEVNW